MPHMGSVQQYGPRQRKCWFKSGTQACLGSLECSRNGSRGDAELPKPGFSIVTLRKPVYDVLLSQAKLRGQSISQYLESTLASERATGTRTVPGQSQIPQNLHALVLRPGFEPGSPDRESGILSASLETGLYYRSRRSEKISLS